MNSDRLIRVHKDRVISTFPKCLNEKSSIDKKYDFDPRVKQVCVSRQDSGTFGLKICKMIIIGDVGVGKTSLVTRFCKKAFDKDYKATIGVDFEVERFEVLGAPFTLQMWDTAGQERFQCIASAYYRGANIVTIVFDLSDIQTLGSAKKWLQASMKENSGAKDIRIFLIGTKKDLVTRATYQAVENEAVQVAESLGAEFWSASSLSGENVKEFFNRVAALAFEKTVLRELEKRTSANQLGDGGMVRVSKSPERKREKKVGNCCKT